MLSICVVIGCAIANYGMAPLFRACPNSMKRAQVILDSINSPGGETPEICIFGNSVVMSGIDAKLVSEGLSGEPEIWNLSSSGQSLLESFLYYQELPESVKVVVQCVFACGIEDGRENLGIEAQKYNAIFLYGLHPNEATRDVIERYASEETKQLLHESDIFQAFTGRWVLRSAVDTSVRSLFRKDLTFSRATNDLFFPSSGAAKISPEKVELIFKRNLPERDHSGFSCPKNSKGFLLDTKELCEKRGIRYVLLILPYHPRYRDHFGAEFVSDVDKFVRAMRTEHGCDIINCMELFDETAFCDHCHIFEPNAKKFSSRIASELTKLGICSSINQHSSSSR